MKFFIGVILCCLAGLVACDLRCFDGLSAVCQRKWDEKVKSDPESFCKATLDFSQCMIKAAAGCEGNLLKEVVNMLIEVASICAQYNYRDLADKNCDFKTLILTRDCYKTLTCKDLNLTRKCIESKYDKCSDEIRVSFRRVTDSILGVQKKICELTESSSSF